MEQTFTHILLKNLFLFICFFCYRNLKYWYQFKIQKLFLTNSPPPLPWSSWPACHNPSPGARQKNGYLEKPADVEHGEVFDHCRADKIVDLKDKPNHYVHSGPYAVNRGLGEEVEENVVGAYQHHLYD